MLFYLPFFINNITTLIRPNKTNIKQQSTHILPFDLYFSKISNISLFY